MRHSHAEYQSACERIERFQKNNRIPWSRFAWLERNLGKEYSNLDRKRWAETVVRRSAKAEKVRSRTIELAGQIDKLPEALLDAMDIKNSHRDPKLGPSSGLLKLGARTSGLGESPQEWIANSLQIAGQGFHEEAFRILTKAFKVETTPDLGTAMEFLPAWIYIGYRYITPERLASGLERQILPRVCGRKPTARCRPIIRSLCLAQVACALNERCDTAGAAELFFEQPVRNLIEAGDDMPWSWPQLVRNMACYWVWRGRDPDKALGLANEAARLRMDEGNMRAVRQVKAAAYRKKQQFGKGWSLIQQDYEAGRKGLLIAEGGGRTAMSGLLHLFSTVLCGTIMRCLAGDVPSNSELDQDVRLLTWCIEQYGVIHMEDASFEAENSALPPALAAITSRCIRRRFTAGEHESLDNLVNAIKEM
jgi:hypothetical protein